MSVKKVQNKKRYHPESHSAEHLLTQTMTRMFKGMVHIGSKVERKKSKVDYTFDREITKDEIKQINTRMNELIKKDLEVKCEVLNLEEAKNRNYDVSHVKDDTIRIVSILEEDGKKPYDSQPCSGHHVQKLSEIGVFNLTTASWNMNNKKILRVRFKVKKQ